MRDVLQVAARSGSGSAARALGSGLAGISTRSRRLLVAATAFLLFVYLAWNMTSTAEPPPREVPPPMSSQTPGPTPAMPLPGGNSVSYSIPLSDLSGLRADTPGGTVIDVWVAWDPPVIEQPKLDRLLTGVVVEQIAPPVTPEGPTVAVLSVARRDVDELLWADRYGSLSAVTVSSRP